MSARPDSGAAPTPLALTMGDPAGIGPDLTLAVWAARAELATPAFAALACPHLLAERARALGLVVPVRAVGRLAEAATLFGRALPVLAIGGSPLRVAPGRPDPATAGAVIASIEGAVALAHAGEAAAVVTNPIAKKTLYDAGFPHPGHTEFLAELASRHWGGAPPRPVMMLAAAELRVVPLTIHVPLARVPGLLSEALVADTTRILAASLARDFGIAQPRIAVAGLNPHAGEGGALGKEEILAITPAIDRLRHEGLSVSGPHSADTLFHAAARARYDAVLAMYHDQALIPIKTLAFDRGVNVTLGLPFVRTSPDHGTAFDIAGSGRASSTSLLEALRLAASMAARRASSS